MVLTDEQQTDAYPVASMETANAASEKLYYTNIDETRSDKPAGYPDDTYTNPNDKVARLNGNSKKIGPAILLKVMSGDQMNIRANAYFRLNGASAGTPSNPASELLAALANSIQGATGGKFGWQQVQSSGVLGPGISDLLQRQTDQYTGSTRPKAFLNWILLDEQFKIVNSSSGFEPVGADGELKTFIKTGLPISQNGYLYVYTSNESPVDVFFDNLQVTHVRGPLLEETHYYPFGLSMSGISSKAAISLQNRNKFNGGNELQSQEFSDGSGLELYDAQYRMYDAQIGRFNRVDPLADFFDDLTPYNFAYNNPILFNDPYGLSPNNDGPNYYAGYVRRTDGTIYFDPNVHDQKDLGPNTDLVYLGERLKGTRGDGTVVWFDENGNSTTTDPGWENLQEVTVTGVRRKPRDFGFYLGQTNTHYNGVLANAELATDALGTIRRGTVVKNFYDLNKAYKYYNDVNLLKPGLAGTKVINGIKGAGKLVKRLGPVGNLLTAGNIAYEIKTDTWDAHTVIDGAILGTTVVVASIAAAPVVAAVAVGAAIYGALDYFFDIGEKVDATIGRNGSAWKDD